MSPDKDRVALVPQMLSQPNLSSLRFGARFNGVVSRIEPPLQPEPKPLTPPLAPFPQVTRSLVAFSVLGKSSLRSEGSLSHTHVRIFRIASRALVVRNLNQIDAVHERIVA